MGIARGMVHLHSHSILHRDLKSLNILVKSTNPRDKSCAKIVDFGESKENFQYSTAGELCGTIRWTAPEIFNNEPFTPKSDVYSFGIILWELVSLEVPYYDIKRDFEVEDFISSGNRLPVPDNCLAGYRTLIQSCWEHDPQARPTFEQALQVLRELKTRLRTLTV